MKYRKKPVVIEAVEWTGYNRDEVLALVAGGDPRGERVVEMAGEDALRIRTLEGDMIAVPGSYIIRGVKGELYPCRPDIFAATYEPVEEPTP